MVNLNKFKLRLDFEDRPIVKAKANSIDGFDSIFKALKEKFKEK